ncbi:hypothetical protein [Roseburia sp. 1XD42-69]|nr:hypothetical protein [Roseburia sp. 1XD42-69]
MKNPFSIDRPASGLIMNREHFLFVPDTPKMLMRDNAREVTKRSAAN